MTDEPVGVKWSGVGLLQGQVLEFIGELIGNVKLAELKVRDIQFVLGEQAKRLSTRSVRLARMILIQAIRNAMGDRRSGAAGAGPEASGRPDWTPRELGHTFGSLLSDSGVPIEQIADAVGYSSTRTTEVV